ncbi:MAG: hypothetical protein K8U03_26025 [Planctomycetia bacterium]|nr:hypothetical protein [Planctomycetia bacterium]
MPNNDNAPSLDKDSHAELEQVRKGKSRKFVMLCKGVSIVSLVVYKKGSVEKYKKQAKEAGTGQVYYGVVQGPGPDIVFKLAASDGFDKEPVKPLVLKQFLEDAGFKFKPDFELVASHPPVLDEDDLLVQRYLKLRDASTTAGAAHPDRAAELKTLCDEIARHLDQDQDDEAVKKLGALESLLGNLSSGTKSTGSNGTIPPAPPLPPQDGEMLRFTARLKALKPELDDLVAEGTPEGAEAKQIAGELPTIAKERAFGKGNQALDRIEELLGGPAPSSSGPPLPPAAMPVTAPDRKLAAALRYLGPDLTQALRAYPERREEIDKLKLAVDQCLKAGRYEEGEQVIGLLDKLLKSLGAVDPEKAAVFREPWSLAREAWDAAVAEVRDQMTELQNVLVDSEDEDLPEIGAFGLNAVTQQHLVPLRAALMELDATGPDRLKTAAKRVQNLLVAFRKHIETSPKVQACEENPFGINVTIRQTLEPGFDALERGLSFITAG